MLNSINLSYLPEKIMNKQPEFSAFAIERHARMTKALTEALSPLILRVVDDSARHIGHAGSHAEGGTHFQINIISATFNGLSHVARHRLIYQALQAEIDAGLHAIAITALTPAEAVMAGHEKSSLSFTEE